MFTGIVREVGAVVAHEGSRLAVKCDMTAETGGSIAVNGACLTVVAADGGVLAFDVVPETERRTNLGRLRPGDRVNLEPALALGQPLDGHIVQGHVDAATDVRSVAPAAAGREITVALPPSLARFVAEKGSVAVDGVSLTVTAVSGDAFGVALIPHTLDRTIAGTYQAGSIVNLEVDVLARYAARLLAK